MDGRVLAVAFGPLVDIGPTDSTTGMQIFNQPIGSLIAYFSADNRRRRSYHGIGAGS